MATRRGRRDKIRTLERKLGFLTERGLSRTSYARLTTEVIDMLKDIDKIKWYFYKLSEDELRASPAFDRAWRDLVWHLGLSVSHWPEGVVWQTAPNDPELYPRPLAFLEDGDRPMLAKSFRVPFNNVVDDFAVSSSTLSSSLSRSELS